MAKRKSGTPHKGWKAAARKRYEPKHTATVYDIPDETLLSRAVRGARSQTCRKGVKHWRWVGVMDTFGLGSTYSHQLCRRFDLDPEEYVTR